MMRSLFLLIKPASGACDSRCKYCFYADVSGKREIKNRGIMSLEILEAIVKKALAETKELCVFGFQGGEPTLAGIEFFRSFIAFEKRHNVNNVTIMHSLQTNGMRIDNEWASFLAENNFLTGISIDAGKKTHDALRVDASAKGTHTRAMRAACLLAKANAPFNVLTVVTKEIARHPDVTYAFYKRHGFDYIQLIPCLDGLNEPHDAHSYSLDADTYGKFLCRIFDLWYTDLIAGHYISIRAFDNYVNILKGRAPESCAMNGICQSYPLIESDGSVYPCDFYAVDEYLLGNVAMQSFSEMLTSASSIAFEALSKEIAPACKECEYFFICKGGCRRDREPVIDGKLSLNYYCNAYQQFFRHALPRLAEIAKLLVLPKNLGKQ